ncbi:Syo1 protein [Martiniozyma asiatica (nom. inval.)]|nr:Syo1 protein [Martiniozyma asiatica]
MAKLKKRSKLSQHRHKINKLRNESNLKPTTLNAQIPKLMSQLESQSPQERIESLSSITLLVDVSNDPNGSICKEFLKSGLIKRGLALTQDVSFEVRCSALGLLRNLTIESGYEMAIHLWRNDIWMVIERGIEEAKSSGQSEYFESLISLLDSLCLELTIEIVDEQIIEKMKSKGIMKILLEILNGFVVKNDSEKVVITTLQLFYDLSSISAGFLELLAKEFNFLQASGSLFGKLNESSLGKIYIIGINFQICEYNDDLNNGQVGQVVEELINVISNIDVSKTIESINNNQIENEEIKQNFQILDSTLDLLSTTVEYEGFLYESQGQKNEKFQKGVIEKIVPFASSLIIKGFKNGKAMVCLNNSLIYLGTTDALVMKAQRDPIINLLNSVDEVSTRQLLQDFEIAKPNAEIIEEICDLISFKYNLIELAAITDSEQIKVCKEIENGIVDYLLNVKLVDFNNIDSEKDNEILTQYITTLIPLLTKIGKFCNNDEKTKQISQFIVDSMLISPLTFYKNALAGKLSVAKYHVKFGYIVESTLNESINAIFEMFDDNYSYNKAIYHDGGLNTVLDTVLSEYKIIYKNIDKNQQMGLKRRSEDTLANLGRFIEYKTGE